LNVLLGVAGLRTRVGRRRPRLREDCLLTAHVLFSCRQDVRAAREVMFPLVGLRLAISNPFLPIQEFDRAALEELPFAGQFLFLTLLGFPNLVGGGGTGLAVGCDESFFRRSEEHTSELQSRV